MSHCYNYHRKEDWYEKMKAEERYHKDCLKNDLLSFWVPFGLGTFITMCILGLDIWFITILPGLVVGGVLGLICSYIAHRYNISQADEYGVSKDNPTLQSEIREKQIAEVVGPVTAIHVAHHTSKSIKEIGNPDSWKEIK